MEGICKGCGQIQEVSASTQKEADIKATLACNCGEAEKLRKRQQLMNDIDLLCGPFSADRGFEPIEQETIDRIKEAADLVFKNKFEKATFSVAGTVVTIKRDSKKVTASRKMTIVAEGVSRI